VNIVFISPDFPPTHVHFCRALRARGAMVLGLGEPGQDALPPEVSGALDEYFAVPDLHANPEGGLRALGYFTWRHGRMDRVESLNEHWLATEAFLREAFHVHGPKPAELERSRTKLGMWRLLREAHLPCPDTEAVVDPNQVCRFGDRHGYPLVLKPDLGVGAARTFKVEGPEGVAHVFEEGPLRDYVVQRYVQGTILTYDGLTDSEGRIVFALSHVYSEGVMETVNERRDMSFWTCPQATPAVEELGRATVRAFHFRERFFHIEIFRRRDGSHLILEVNLRPPGGFMTDMMNYACDMDVYHLWARAVTRDATLSSFVCQPRYHVAHVARRFGTHYQHSPEEIRGRLGEHLLWHRTTPPLFSPIMGDEMFLTRHETADAMRADVAFIQARQ
jgi:hypothetical protein